MNENAILDRLVNNIIDYTMQTRERVYNNVRQEMINYYWNVGKMIVEEEQGGDITPEYGRKLYIELSKRLTKFVIPFCIIIGIAIASTIL